MPNTLWKKFVQKKKRQHRRLESKPTYAENITLRPKLILDK